MDENIIVEVLITTCTKLTRIKRQNALVLFSLKKRPGGDQIAVFKYISCSCREKMNYLFSIIMLDRIKTNKVLWNKEDSS